MTLEKTVSREFNQYQDFEIGDIVALRSGGPRMTINRAAGSDYECVWFAENVIHRMGFHQASIEKVPDAPKHTLD